MTFFPFDSEAVSISYFAAALVPQAGDIAAALGCDRHFAARVAAIKVFREGWRTSTLPGDLRIACKVDRPIPRGDDDPGPGSRADIAA